MSLIESQPLSFSSSRSYSQLANSIPATSSHVIPFIQRYRDNFAFEQRYDLPNLLSTLATKNFEDLPTEPEPVLIGFSKKIIEAWSKKARYTYTDKYDHLNCPICYHGLKDPEIHKDCGNAVCKECLYRSSNGARMLKCCACRGDMSSGGNRITGGGIVSLKKSLERGEVECQCGTVMLQEQIYKHACLKCLQNCGVAVSVHEIHHHLKHDCKKTPIYCIAKEYGCKWTGTRDKFINHKNECGVYISLFRLKKESDKVQHLEELLKKESESVQRFVNELNEYKRRYGKPSKNTNSNTNSTLPLRLEYHPSLSLSSCTVVENVESVLHSMDGDVIKIKRARGRPRKITPYCKV